MAESPRMGKSWRQELEAAGHIVPCELDTDKDGCSCSASFYAAQDPVSVS